MKQPSPRRRTGRLLGTITTAVLSAVLFAACTSGSSDNSITSDLVAPDGSVQGSTDEGDTSEGSIGQGGGEQGAGDAAVGTIEGVTSDVQASDRSIITTGSVSITVGDPIDAVQAAVTLTEQAGGRIDSRNETPATDNQPASASLTLRIPADALDRTVADLKQLGAVNFVSLNASDVTQQSQDLDARITSLQTSVDRLLALITTAVSTADLIAIESALSTRQSELEGLQSQRTYLSDQIDFSTLTLELYSEGTVAPSSPDNFFTGLIAGWNALLAALGGLLVGFGVALPWIVTIGVLAGIVVLIVWVSTRKRKAA
jgi:hypothetical protein